MNIGYMIYQTERTLTPAEQREADIRNAEVAATVAKWFRALLPWPAIERSNGASSICTIRLADYR